MRLHPPASPLQSSRPDWRQYRRQLRSSPAGAGPGARATRSSIRPPYKQAHLEAQSRLSVGADRAAPTSSYPVASREPRQVYYATTAEAGERLRREFAVRRRSGFAADWLGPGDLRHLTGIRPRSDSDTRECAVRSVSGVSGHRSILRRAGSRHLRAIPRAAN